MQTTVDYVGPKRDSGIRIDASIFGVEIKHKTYCILQDFGKSDILRFEVDSSLEHGILYLKDGSLFKTLGKYRTESVKTQDSTRLIVGIMLHNTSELKKLREDNQSMHGIGLIIFLGVIINFNATLSQTDDADECAFLLLVNILGKKDSKTKQ